ncbi:sigma-54-dependent transcriptional regulator, partial [Longispora fulva]|uniref:sigma-54-dependent transcriptional regulator n=2 Tax=Bacteria TaxID=2 RepID=UPI0036437494
KTFLIKNKCEVDAAFSAKEALNLIDDNRYDLVISDVRLPDREGLEVLRAVKETNPETGVIMMTSYAEISMAVNAMKEGAIDYLAKPFHPEVILEAINSAMDSGKKEKEATRKSPRRKTANEASKNTFIAGVSEASEKLNNYIDLVAPTNMSVLIMGESGTGKEQIAKSIHHKSKRKEAPFIA